MEQVGEAPQSHSCIHDHILEQHRRFGRKEYSVTPQTYGDESGFIENHRKGRELLVVANKNSQLNKKQPIRIFLNYDAVGHSLDKDFRNIGDIVKSLQFMVIAGTTALQRIYQEKTRKCDSMRGPDVKNTFAANLYRRLLDHGLRVFLDKVELLEGHPITPQIHAAIQVASVHIAIFSSTYADSRWCLEELVLMLQSKATILPVFYQVKPSQLTWTTNNDGPYAKSLWQLQQKKSVDPQTGEEKQRLYDSNTIQNWRDALSKAADISGFELQGDDEELLNRIVQGVLKNVSKPPLYVTKYPTGVEDKLQDFEATVLQQVEQRVSARVMGIVGFGGVGKTTLAKAFFNSKRSYYNESSFLFDVREKSARISLSYLQSKLIEDLKQINIKIERPDEGIGILRRYLSSCQALIILDDVDNVHQLEVILPIKDVISPESLILITSRDKHILKSSGVLESSIYNLKGLNTQLSKELFCSYAFYQPLPPLEFEGLVDRFVEACDGLPLSLKVIGALVCGEDDKVYWEEQLDRLHQTLPSEILERLRISYDSLSKRDQEIFLDIACFFLGEQRDKAIRIWGLVGLRNLENKCLLEVDSESEIRMHAHIRDCARIIAEEGSMPRRLWHRTTNNMDDLLEQTGPYGITEVRGITTVNVFDVFRFKDWEKSSYMRPESAMRANNVSNGVDPFNNWHFRGIRNLQLVAAAGCDLEIILRRAQSSHLVWVRWCGCSDSSLPAWIPMENLRVLEVEGSRLNFLWPHQSQGPLQLRELNIYAPLSEFPKSIGQLKHLERIAITNGHSLPATVETLPQEFCDLRSLKFLVLKWFSKMKSLPDSFGKLTNLQHIDLGGASSLQGLPNSFGDLSRLEHLYLNGARDMMSLPDSFGKLTNLRHIDFRGASSLKMLPNTFGDLSRLQHLSLNGATALMSLPDSFRKLTNLQHIHLGGASSLLPKPVGDLSRVKHLSLTISSGILGNITTLEYLNLEFCSNVHELAPQIAHQRSLKYLYMKSTDLKELQCFIERDHCNLEVLHIRLPPSVRYSESLEELHVPHSPKLKYMPDSFGLFTNLTELVLEGCAIEYLPEGLLNLNNLRHLQVLDCPLRELPFRTDEGEAEGRRAWNQLDSGNDKCMPRLRDLWLRGTKISEVTFPKGVCPNLISLGMEDCQELRRIRGLCGLSKLEYLWIKSCVKVEDLASLENLRSLHRVIVRGCGKLKSITGLGQLTELRYLWVSGCHEMVELTGVEHCMRLSYLDARYCPNLQWGEGVLQQLRLRLQEGLHVDVKPYKRRKLRGNQ